MKTYIFELGNLACEKVFIYKNNRANVKRLLELKSEIGTTRLIITGASKLIDKNSIR